MINALELRIDNLVLVEGKPRVVDLIQPSFNKHGKYVIGLTPGGLALCTEDDERIRGIELTEEWLLKFGFEKIKFSDNSEYLEIDKADYRNFRNPIYKNNEFWKCYRFQFFKNEWYFEVHKERNFNQYFVQKKIDFIHQLQNLFFALTGEELTIKETAQ